MTSQIDVTKPVFGTPTTQSVRDNFTTAANEITTLQNQAVGSPFLPLAGGRMSGAMYLFNDPTDAMMPATKGYVDAQSGSGAGGIPEAPSDAFTYGRFSGAWRSVLPLIGGTLTGALILAADPTNVLGAVTKQYADAIAASHLTDAPNDANTYGRRGAAWAGVLPIVGGQLNGSLGVGLPLPATVSTTNRHVIAGYMAAGAFSNNAYVDTAGAWRYRATGSAMTLSGAANGLNIFAAPSGAADAVVNWGPALVFDTKGNLIMPGSRPIPTDNTAPWISSNEFVTAGHYAFNCYIAAPSAWKFLSAGYCAQWWQDITGSGSVILNISQSSGAAGGAMGPAGSFLFDPMGHFTMYGQLRGGPAIMAVSSAGNAFVGAWQTAGTTPSNVGIWNYNNALYFGNADGNGQPTTARANLDAAGTLSLEGPALYLKGIATGFGIYDNAADLRLLQFAPQWYLGWTISTGQLSWGAAGTPMLSMRITPDHLMWNAGGAVGGFGAYIDLSDARSKRDVSLATVGLAEVIQLEPINFTRVPFQPPPPATMPDGSVIPPVTHPPEIGFSAQQVQPIIPEAVHIMGSTLPNGSGGLDTDDPSLGVITTAILAAAVNAIKEIEARLVAKGI